MRQDSIRFQMLRASLMEQYTWVFLIAEIFFMILFFIRCEIPEIHHTAVHKEKRFQLITETHRLILFFLLVNASAGARK